MRLAQHRRRAVTRAFRLLVVLFAGRDLLLFAKYLFARARDCGLENRHPGAMQASAKWEGAPAGTATIPRPRAPVELGLIVGVLGAIEQARQV